MAYFVCFIIGQFPVLISWTINGFSDVLALLGYHKYVRLFNTNPLYAFHRCSFGVISISLIVSHLFLIYYYPKLREYYNGNKFFTICSTLTLIYVCYFVLVMNTSFYFKRPYELLLPFIVIASAFLMVYLLKTKRFAQLSVFALSISLLQQSQFLKLPTSEWLTPLISITSYHYNADFCCHTGL